MINNAKPQTLAGFLAELWRNWRQEGTAFARMENCGSRAQRGTHDRELACDDFRVLAAKRPGTVDLLLHGRVLSTGPEPDG